MAMPTSAAASAGASLTPSPTMATRRPSPRSRCTTSLLRSGSTPASISSMPSCDATARAVVRLSPVSITMRRPSSRSACKRGLRRRLDRIGDRDDAGGAAVDRDIDRGGAILPRGLRGGVEIAASRRSVRPSASHCRARRPCHRRSRSRPCRKATAKSLTSPRLELARLGGIQDRLRQRMLAAALDAGGKPQHFAFLEAFGRRRCRRLSACLRSACRSCRSPGCRCSRAAPAPRRRGSGCRNARRGRRRP